MPPSSSRAITSVVWRYKRDYWRINFIFCLNIFRQRNIIIRRQCLFLEKIAKCSVYFLNLWSALKFLYLWPGRFMSPKSLWVSKGSFKESKSFFFFFFQTRLISRLSSYEQWIIKVLKGGRFLWCAAINNNSKLFIAIKFHWVDQNSWMFVLYSVSITILRVSCSSILLHKKHPNCKTLARTLKYLPCNEAVILDLTHDAFRVWAAWFHLSISSANQLMNFIF